jgi:hypothetical protein
MAVRITARITTATLHHVVISVENDFVTSASGLLESSYLSGLVAEGAADYIYEGAS